MLTATVAAGLVVTGCTGDRPAQVAPEAPRSFGVVFEDVTEAAGIRFVHETGATGNKWLPETMGSGCVWLDVDLDGNPDLFLVNSTTWPGEPRDRTPLPALYRNRGDGTFEDVTEASGLAVESYGMGAAAGDYDNDGDPDLYVSALGGDSLYRNRGDGTFEDVTGIAGVSDPAFGSSATFVDYDRDGELDLFACNYVTWTPETDIFCTLDGTRKSYCTPESYPGATCRMYRNRGDGTFEDVTERAGVGNDNGKSLGVLAYDENGDIWPDLVVSNDTEPNYLYRNNGDGTFTEIGERVGIAFAESGAARAGMGVDAADYDDSGRESVMITNFSNEMIGVYNKNGADLYVDDAATAGIGGPSLLTLGFGGFFFDADLDGWPDLFVANGHVEPEVNAVQKNVTYAQRPHLFWNQGNGRFREVTGEVGDDMNVPMVGRGAAFADYDGDGDLDVALTTNGGTARLFRNDRSNGNGWIRLRLVGTESNRDAFGARLVAEISGRTKLRFVRASSSYLSQSEKTVTIGLGEASVMDRLSVTWPSGAEQAFDGLPGGRTITIVEGEEGFR